MMIIKTEREKVQELLFAYGNGIDQKDFAALAGCFTEDAVFDYGDSMPTGGKAIAEFVAEAVEHVEGTQHFFTNFIVDIEGDRGRFICDSLGQHWRNGPHGGDKWLASGKYTVEVQRVDGDWKISHAKVRPVWSEGNPAIFHPA